MIRNCFSPVKSYIRERNDISISEQPSNQTDIITLQVTDTLDNAIFNLPVTIRRPLPLGWSSATVSQNGQPVDVSIVEVESTDYIMFDAVPDGGDVVIANVVAFPVNLTATAGYASVGLDWDDGSDMTGYHVYRSPTSHSGYSKLNPSLLGSSSYEDDTIPLDTTYYYVVTGVDSNSVETGYSNEVFSGLYGDFTGNGIVKMNDVSLFAHFWKISDCNQAPAVDVDDDCIIKVNELDILTKNWMQDP